jgi:cytochrome P450
METTRRCGARRGICQAVATNSYSVVTGSGLMDDSRLRARRSFESDEDPARSAAFPETRVADLARLFGALFAELFREGRNASMRRALRSWSTQTSARLQTPNFILRVGARRILLVGGAELSRCILAVKPGAGLESGEMKRKGMAFLAPKALTISDGPSWERRRAFNELVLQPGRTHSLAAEFLPRIRNAFKEPITDVASVRAAMRRAMCSIVFGPNEQLDLLTDDVERLFNLVQSPVRRTLFGFAQGSRRRRVREMLRNRWRDAGAHGQPSLLQLAHSVRGDLTEEEAIDQIPHWMFTFTGSATDLLVRTLALILSSVETQNEVVARFKARDTTPEAASTLSTICLLETGMLYPPVAWTFHHAMDDLTIARSRVPRGMEIMQAFPLTEQWRADAPPFQPSRFESVSSLRAESAFDPFLGGARGCPGQSLILFVCDIALYELLIARPIALDSAPLNSASPPSLVLDRQLRFRSATSAGGA